MRRRWYANAREIVGSGTGDGATVVLAHGYGVNQESCWGKIMPSIVSQASKVILFDWDFTTTAHHHEEEDCFTFGRFADDLIELMDEKNVRGAVLVGHSMSAMVACIASKRRPELFAQLILLCASPRYINSSPLESEEEYVGGFEESAIHGMLAAMETDFSGWVHGFVPNAAGDPACVEPLERSFLAMDPAVAVGVARMIFLGDQRDALDAVPVPCVLVQARHDFAAPVVVAEYMRRRMSNNNKAGVAAVELEVVDSAGHFPQLVAPERVLDIVHDVLRRTSNARPAVAAEVP